MSSPSLHRLLRVIFLAAVGILASGAALADKAPALTLSAALHRVNLFSKLSEPEIDALKTVATLRRGRAGEQIITQGTRTGRMFIVMEGRAEVRVNGQYLLTLSGQSILGEIEFLDDGTASADVILHEDADLVVLDNAALLGLMETQPRLGFVLMRELARIEARRLRATNPK